MHIIDQHHWTSRSSHVRLFKAIWIKLSEKSFSFRKDTERKYNKLCNYL